jgi:hypothetical protein
VKIVSYFRVASHTTLNIILYEPRQENISGWKEESAGEFSEIGLGGSSLRRLCTRSQAARRKYCRP